jgi:hypothetical protein
MFICFISPTFADLVSSHGKSSAKSAYNCMADKALLAKKYSLVGRLNGILFGI